MMTLSDCTEEEQTTVMATFSEIECLALDICTDGEEDPPVIDRAPEECVDPAIIADETVCEPEAAFECMRTFKIVAGDPFVTDSAVACL